MVLGAFWYGSAIKFHTCYAIIRASAPEEWCDELDQINNMNLPRSIIGIFAAFVVVFATLAPVSAAEKTDSTSSYGGGSVQAYAADASFDFGTIVQLDGKVANRVKVATQKEQQNMFGVVVDRNQLPLTITNEGTENETFVAVSGTYNVLVSNQAGNISIGDYITLSSLNGVAMNAGTEEGTVFGRATRAFDGKTSVIGKSDIKDTSGKVTKSVAIGSIPVTINIQRNPNEKSTKVLVPEFLERVGQAIAEKEVSPIRIYLSMGIAAISLIAAIAVLYSGVRHSLISIGRNPMTKKSIFRAMLEIILTTILILVIGLFAVYLLLKL